MSSFRELFEFSKRETRGVIVLLVLISVLFVATFFEDYFVEDSTNNFEEFDRKIQQLIVIKQDSSHGKKESLFVFDPNVVTQEELIQLGLSKRQAEIFINYRNAGVVFYNKRDILNCYSIDSQNYERLEPYIEIKKKIVTPLPQTKKTVSKIVTPQKVLVVEINTADTTELKKIKGIGSVFALRIIKYRNLLGGFYDKKQLLEVYGIDTMMYNKIREYITVNSSLIKKEDINKISFKQLNRSPYISYIQTKQIFRYREIVGKIHSCSELVDNHIIDTLTYNKVKNYLKTE